MANAKSVRLQDCLAELADPRRYEEVYPVINAVVIAIGAVIGRTERAWLTRFLDRTKGIPSHDRFNAIGPRLVRVSGPG
jgi:hypothetical protein